MAPGSELAICVDVGGTFIKTALVDKEGTIHERNQILTESGLGRERVLGNILHAIGEFITPKNHGRIIGIGMGVPGSIDTKSGTIIAGISNIPELAGVALVEAVSGKFRVPSYLDNDATNAARGEYLFGAGRYFRNILCVTLGTGIGGGIILDGKVYQGTSDYAGEFGHMIVVPEGRECSCGNLGCIEAYASGTAMVAAARARIRKSVTGALLERKDQEITPRLIAELAEQGDPQSVEILHEAGRYLGICLASTVNLLNLERCIIGGGVAAAGSHLMDPVRAYFNAYVLPEAGKQCEVVLAELQNDAGLLGSAALVFMTHE